MVDIKTFKAIRPRAGMVKEVAALPYDAISLEDARKEIKKYSNSFLKVDLPAASLSEKIDQYDKRVYEKAKENFDSLLKNEVLKEDQESSFYIYSLETDLREQTGLVVTTSIDDYLEDRIKKHEQTRNLKQEDRIKHIDKLDATTGPIFMIYKNNKDIERLIEEYKKNQPLYDFYSDDKIRHKIWKIRDEKINESLIEKFKRIDSLYIADGHHRAKAAVEVGLKKRRENKNFTKNENFNYFLSILYPQDQVKIYEYNRLVKDLNGYTKDEFLEKIGKNFTIKKLEKIKKSQKKGEFIMLLEDEAYSLELKEKIEKKDLVSNLDVSILQDYILDPILAIKNPRQDSRIEFVGRITGIKELSKKRGQEYKLAFCLYPTSLKDLFDIADSKKIMPPKSTWFEPKPRSGIFIHKI